MSTTPVIVGSCGYGVSYEKLRPLSNSWKRSLLLQDLERPCWTSSFEVDDLVLGLVEWTEFKGD